MVILQVRHIFWVWLALLVARGVMAMEEEDEEEDVNNAAYEDEQIPVSEHEYPRDNIMTRPDYRGPGHWITPAPDSNIDVGFVPVKMYAQVRRSNTVKHLPRSDALASASTPEEIVNAPRLREVISHKKISEVYSEEGYEDSAYDHGGYDKNAENHEGYEKDEGKRKPKRQPASHHCDSDSQGSNSHQQEVIPESIELSRPRMTRNMMRKEKLMISMEDHTDGQVPVTLMAGYSHTISHPQHIPKQVEKRQDLAHPTQGSEIQQEYKSHTDDNSELEFESLREIMEPVNSGTVESRHNITDAVPEKELTAGAQEGSLLEFEKHQQSVSSRKSTDATHTNTYRSVTQASTKLESSEGLWLPQFLRLPWFRLGEFSKNESNNTNNKLIYSRTPNEVSMRNFDTTEPTKKTELKSFPRQTDWSKPQESKELSIPVRNREQNVNLKHGNSKVSISNSDKIPHAYWKPTYKFKLPGTMNSNINLSSLNSDQLPHGYWKPTYHLRQAGMAQHSNTILSEALAPTTVVSPTQRLKSAISLQGIIIYNPSNEHPHKYLEQKQVIFNPIEHSPTALVKFVSATGNIPSKNHERSLLGNALLSIHGIPQQQIYPEHIAGAIPKPHYSRTTEVHNGLQSPSLFVQNTEGFIEESIPVTSIMSTTQQVIMRSSKTSTAIPTGEVPKIVQIPYTQVFSQWHSTTETPTTKAVESQLDESPPLVDRAYSTTVPVTVPAPSEILRPPGQPSSVQHITSREILHEGESTNLGENFAPQGFWGAEGFWGPLQKLVQEDKPKVKYVAPAYGKIIISSASIVENNTSSTHLRNNHLKNKNISDDINKGQNNTQDSANKESIIKENSTGPLYSEESGRHIISKTEQNDVSSSHQVENVQSTVNPNKAIQSVTETAILRTASRKYHKQLNKHDRLKLHENNTHPQENKESSNLFQTKNIERLTLAQFSSFSVEPVTPVTGRRSYMRDSSSWHADDEPRSETILHTRETGTGRAEEQHRDGEIATTAPAKSSRNLRSTHISTTNDGNVSGKRTLDKRRYLLSEEEDRRVEEEAQRLEEMKDREVNNNSGEWKEAVRIAALGKNPNKPLNIIKYPYYKSPPSHMLSSYSPLRYATNPREIPRKTEGGMDFYESRENVYCPEVSPNLDVVPKRQKEGEWNKKPRVRLPRLRALGDKIDCLRTKYFGLEPLDNPFFKEKSIHNPEVATSDHIDFIDVDDQLGFYADIKGFVSEIQGLGHLGSNSESIRIKEAYRVPIYPQATQEYSTIRNGLSPPEVSHREVTQNNLKITKNLQFSHPVDVNKKQKYLQNKYPVKYERGGYSKPISHPAILSPSTYGYAQGKLQEVDSYSNYPNPYSLYSKGIIPPPKTNYLLPLLVNPTQGIASAPISSGAPQVLVEGATEGYRNNVGILPPPASADQPAAASMFHQRIPHELIPDGVIKDSMASETDNAQDMSVAETSFPQAIVDLQGNPVSPLGLQRQDQNAVVSQLNEESKRIVHYEETITDPTDEDVYVEKRYNPRSSSREEPRARSKDSRRHKSTRLSTRKVYKDDPSNTGASVALGDVSHQRLISNRRSDDYEVAVQMYPTRATYRTNSRKKSKESGTKANEEYSYLITRNKNLGTRNRIQQKIRDADEKKELKKTNRGNLKQRGRTIEQVVSDKDKRRGEPRYSKEEEVIVAHGRNTSQNNLRKGNVMETRFSTEEMSAENYGQKGVITPHRFSKVNNTRKVEGKTSGNKISAYKQRSSRQDTSDSDYQTPSVEEILPDVSYDYGTEYEQADALNMSEPRPFTEEQDLKFDDSERVRYMQLGNRKVVEKLKGSASWLTPQQVNRVLGGFISRHHPTYSSKYNSEETTFPLEDEKNETNQFPDPTTTMATHSTLYIPTIPITTTAATTTSAKPARKLNRSNSLRVVPITNIRLAPELVTSTEKVLEIFGSKPKRLNSKTSLNSEIVVDNSGSRWQRGREKQRSHSGDVTSESVGKNRKAELNDNYKEVTSVDNVFKRRHSPGKERSLVRWRQADETSTQPYELYKRGNRERIKNASIHNRVRDTPQQSVEISRSRSSNRRGRVKTAYGNNVQPREPKSVTSKTTTEQKTAPTTVSPRRLQAVEHRRVTKEEIFTRTYIPDDNLEEEMEREAEEGVEEELNKREVEGEEKEYEPYESLNYDPKYITYQENRLGQVESPIAKEDWDRKPPYYDDILYRSHLDKGDVQHTRTQSVAHALEYIDHVAEPGSRDKARKKKINGNINEPLSGRQTSLNVELNPRMVVTKDGVKGFYLQKSLEAKAHQPKKKLRKDELQKGNNEREKTFAYYVDPKSGTGRWAEEREEPKETRKINSNRRPEQIESIPETSSTDWVSVRGAQRDELSRAIKIDPDEMHVDKRAKYQKKFQIKSTLITDIQHNDPELKPKENGSNILREEQKKLKDKTDPRSSNYNDSTRRYRDKTNVESYEDYHTEDDVSGMEKPVSPIRPRHRRIHDGDQRQEYEGLMENLSNDTLNRNRGASMRKENSYQYEEAPYEEEGVVRYEDSKVAKERGDNSNYRALISKETQARSVKQDLDTQRDSEDEKQDEEELDHKVYVLGRILSSVPPRQRATVMQEMTRFNPKHKIIKDPGNRKYFYVEDETDTRRDHELEEESDESQPVVTVRRTHARRSQ